MSKFRFDRKAQKWRSQKSALLDRMANNAVHAFKVEAFDEKSFNGQTWANRKDGDSSRQLLVKTGRMRSSITVLKRSSDSRVVGSNVPYAQYHNEGTGILPKRQFIGRSQKLEAKNKLLILQFTGKIV